LYPLFLIAPNTDIGHAHNQILQVALDLGLPGLVAYVAMIGAALWLCWRVVHRTQGASPLLAIGIIGSLVAFHLFGLTDALALGAKPGVGLWLLLGLVAALWSANLSASGALGSEAADRAEAVGAG
jgi:putative inorganic carbon (HCO3(-)) transporter